mgnify:CR=1 FL=1
MFQRSGLAAGNGAADLIFALVAALRPRHALLLAPSFLEYSQALHLWGCETDSFMLREDEDFSLDPFRLKEALFRARAEKQPYDILFLCNPNNPTGLPVKKEIVEEIGAVCKETGTWLAVDECFCDFLDEPEAYSVIPKLKDLDHVIVLKAFTKIYAMAGLRLGYGLCSDSAFWNGFRQYASPGPCPARPSAAGVGGLGETDLRSAPERCLKGSGRGFLQPSMTWAFRYIHPKPIICSFGTGKRMVSWKKAGFTRSCWAGAS